MSTPMIEFIKKILAAIGWKPQSSSLSGGQSDAPLEALWNSGKPSQIEGPRVDFARAIAAAPNANPAKKKLLKKIEALGYSVPDWKYKIFVPVVSIEDFFDGNDEPDSIAVNLDPHPGLEFFRKKLSAIRKRADVQDVLLDIYHIDESDEGEPHWPSPECIYVISSTSEEQVEKWNGQLRADGPIEGWIDGVTPNGAPQIADGNRVWRIMWD
jgi:hypothetical protein